MRWSASGITWSIDVHSERSAYPMLAVIGKAKPGISRTAFSIRLISDCTASGLTSARNTRNSSPPKRMAKSRERITFWRRSAKLITAESPRMCSAAFSFISNSPVIYKLLSDGCHFVLFILISTASSFDIQRFCYYHP